MASSTARSLAAPPQIPLWYRLFCLYIEPLSTTIGFIYAQFLPQTYLHLTDAASFASPVVSSSNPIPLGTHIVLRQLANLYLAFTLNEALVLRVTNDVRVWRTLLFGLLIADFGHLASVSGHGLGIYTDVWRWNAIDWGNLGFVYLGAATRICFLLGVGFAAPGQGVADGRALRQGKGKDL